MKRKLFLILTLALFSLLGCNLGGMNNTVSGSSDSRTPVSGSGSDGQRTTTLKTDDANSANTPNSVNTQNPPPAQTANAICPNPAKPCKHKEKEFAEWELSFKMPAKLKGNTTYKSAPFYAVILKTYSMDDDCDGGEFIEAAEKDRKKEQAMQLERKVFASYMCPNMDAVNYDFAGRMDAKKERVILDNFIAIYAGATQQEADMTLQSMKSEYPKAVLKRMTAMYERMEQ